MSLPPGRLSRWPVACRSMVRVDRPVGEVTLSAVEVAASGPGTFDGRPRLEIPGVQPWSGWLQPHVEVRTGHIVLQRDCGADLGTPAPRFQCTLRGSLLQRTSAFRARRVAAVPHVTPGPVRTSSASGLRGRPTSGPAAWCAAGRIDPGRETQGRGPDHDRARAIGLAVVAGSADPRADGTVVGLRRFAPGNSRGPSGWR